MTDNDYTRRTTLKRLGASLTASSLLTASAVGTGAADSATITPAQDLPVIQPGEEGTFDNMTEGWSNIENASDDPLVEHDQTARLGSDRATLYTDAGALNSADLNQEAVIGKAFEVSGESETTLTVEPEGSYNGVVEATGAATVDVIGEVGVGPYSEVRAALAGQPQAAAPAVTTYELFDRTVANGREVFATPAIAVPALSVTVPANPPAYIAYARLRAVVAAPVASSATVDFSPAGPDLASATTRSQTADGQSPTILAPVYGLGYSSYSYSY